MFSESVTLAHVIFAVAFLVGGIIVGFAVERIIFSRIHRFAKKTQWQGDEVIISAMRGAPILLFGILGFYSALAYLPLKPAIETLSQKALLVIIIFAVTLVIARLAAGFIRLQSSKTAGALPSASLFINLTRIVVFIVGILIILQSLGISITPLITALGIGGLAVALALQPTLSNLFAGIQIIVSKQLETGDYVELDSGAKGYVTDISWRNTTIRELPNNLIIVPNAKLADSIVKNFNRPQKEMSVLVDVGVSYTSDLEKVEQVTLDVAKKVVQELQEGTSEFEPFLYYKEFADFSINFTVIFRVHEYVNKFMARHEFIKRLHKRYKQEGIEIPFPIRTVHLKQMKEKGDSPLL